jgi:hypothetical protein
MKEKSRKILRVLFCCVLSGVVVVAISIGVLWLKMIRDDRVARVEIQKRLDAIRNAGQPLTAQDLAKLYPDPLPEHDAVLLLKPALAALVIPKDSTNLPFFGEADWPRGTAPLEKPMLDEIQVWMDKNQKAFDTVPLEKLKVAWIGCSFANGFTNLVYAPVSEIDSLVKLLCLNAVLQAELQHPKEAIQSLQKAVAIGNTWRNDFPLLGLVKLYTEVWICSTLERVLNRTAIADSDLMSISDSLIITNLGTTKQSVIFYRCEGLFHANYLQSLANQIRIYTLSPVRLLINSYRARIIYRDQDLLNFLEGNERVFATMDLPLSNAIPTLLDINRDAANFIKKHHVNFLNTFKKDRISFLTTIEPPINHFLFNHFLLLEADTVAQVRVTRTALAIERWRLAHNGNVPNSLAELVPDFLPSVTIDPFDGQQLRYKKLARGYVIYSIGRDFTDDGGKEKPADAKESDHYDITFTVER